MKKDILFVDDDQELAMVAIDLFEDRGLACLYAKDAREAEEMLFKYQVSLIVLDINLPGDNGFTFCKRLRNESEVPVIFVSARTSDTDKINGLDLGGDDYLAKPYSLLELYSRVQALIRRTYGYAVKKPVVFADISIDVSGRKVMKGSEPLDMTGKEFDLLKYLATHPHDVLTKEKLFAEVWGTQAEASLSTLYAHIRWLREKIEQQPSKPEHIQTVHGIGYRFVP